MKFSQLNKKRRGRVLQRTVSLLAALSVFLTCYVLIIPAITMTKENADTYCGMEEHRHKKSCFDENGNLICPLQEHEHDMLCFTNTASETCLCGFECEHTHNESCYQNGELICTIAEHTHGDSCREKLPKQELTAESDRFTVSVVAPQGALPEGTTMYVLDVIPNGSAEQTQTQTTFAFQLLFTDANGQAVTPRRMVYIKALCSGFLYEGNRTVTKIAKDATKEELESIPVSVNGVTFADTEVATYLVTCRADEAKKQDMKTLCVTQNDVTVTVEYGKDADIPEDATLSVKEFSPNSKDYQSCVKKSKEAMEDEKIHSARVFDISFRHLGKEIEPKAPVNVSVNSTNPLTDDRSNLRIVHIKDNDETEVLKAAEINEDATQLVYQQASFSAVVITTVENSFTGPYTGDNQYTTVSGSILDNDAILNRFNNDNKWQIVSGEYHGNGSSQKVDVQEHIRGQKNIIPTGVENEFYIYLSLDLDYQNLVTNFLVGEAGIVFTSSNQINDDESTIHGDLCTQAWNDKKATSCTPALLEPTDEMKQKWTLTFKYEVNGKVQSTSVTRYSTNNAYNKGHVCMLLDGTWYEVGEASKASAASTIDIALKSSMVQKVLKGLQDVEIGTLQDSMGSSTAGGESFTTGEGIFVTEVVASAVRGQLVTDNYSISDDHKTINWSPKVSALVPTSNESSSGWFENIAELLYKIKYVAPKSNGLSTGGTSLPDDADAKTSYVVT
ncbi:MAG TPA: hypothetical protein DDY98_05875, partial [Ruminococcaceae bacterium]|nr:hypothetical protein [Oscillospiraceae bacterium]